MNALAVLACGPMTTMQDAGRFGWQRFGVSASGAMDRLALAAANALVGNPPSTAALEFVLMGGSFEAEGAVRLALAGAGCPVSIDGEPVPPMTSAVVERGQRLGIGAARDGVYAYLAVGGGFAVPPQLGSLSVQPRAGIGGIAGRPLRPGDRLPLALAEPAPARELSLGPMPIDSEAVIRAVLGPQDDMFTADGIETLLTSTYTVSREADRMGYRLTGPKVSHVGGFNIVSDGIVAGSVQVPGAGEPIVMMADRQTTGGYPKIATVISADLGVLAHRRPGQGVRFARVSIGEAEAAARGRAELIRSLPMLARPVRSGPASNEELLGLNLAGHAVDALAPEV